MALTAPRLPPLPAQTTHHHQSDVQVPVSVAPWKRGLNERQLAALGNLTSVCGYISGNASYPITCDNAYCGYNYPLQAVGCCLSYNSTLTSQTVLDSCIYYIGCVGGDQVDSYCDTVCQSNDMILKCTEGSATYCNTFSYSGYGYNAFACGTLMGVFNAKLSTDSPSLTVPPPWVSTTYTPGIFTNGLNGPSTMTNAFPRVIQSSNELGEHVGMIMAIVVGSFLGLATIVAFIMFVCLRKRSRTRTVVRLDTNYDYGQPLAQVHRERPAFEPLRQEQYNPTQYAYRV